MCRAVVSCRCGARGCIEAYAGFYAMLRTAFDVPLDTIPAKFVPIAELDKIAASARQGGRRNVLAFRQAGLAPRQWPLAGPEPRTSGMPIVITGPGVRYYDLLIEGITGRAGGILCRADGG